MKTMLVVLAAFICTVLGSSDAMGFGGGGGSSKHRANTGITSNTTGSSKSVPEPSTLYAIASGAVLLGGAAWIIRRK